MNRIKELRNEKKLSLRGFIEKLEKEVGLTVSVSAMNRYERNIVEPPTSVIFILSDYFQVTPDYLKGYTNNKKGEIKKEETNERLTAENIFDYGYNAYKKIFSKLDNQTAYGDLLNLMDILTSITSLDSKQIFLLSEIAKEYKILNEAVELLENND
jgi:transcriptional regulator with XRE-family HTH domain